MSATAIRNIRIDFEPGDRASVPVHLGAVRHHLSPADVVERCECGKRLSPGEHELCSRCDQAAFDRLPLPTAMQLDGRGI